MSLAQNNSWDHLLETIKYEKRNIKRIVYSESDDFTEDKDSLFISNNIHKFEDIKLSLYHHEISMEPDVEYYVVGMDIPIMEFIELEDREQGFTLIFSRKCELNSNDEKHRLHLKLLNKRAEEKLYFAFEEILKIRKSKHRALHELNQCNIGADY